MTTTDGGVYNGMPAAELGEKGWERPCSGTNGGQCVEMKRLPKRVGGVRKPGSSQAVACRRLAMIPPGVSSVSRCAKPLP